MLKISFIAENGCLFSGISGIIDSFVIANLWNAQIYGNTTTPLFQTQIISSKKEPLKLNGGICIIPKKKLMDVEDTDMIIVPPFLPNSEIIAENNEELFDFLKQFYQHGTKIASLCSGSFVLGHAGLLDGRIATTNWAFASKFENMFPKVKLKSELILAEDDGIITTGAASSFYNLSLYIIEKYGSAKIAGLCSKSLLVDSGAKSQASYSIFVKSKNHGDEIVLNAQKYMEDNFSKTILIEELAQSFSISSRHFKRRFKSATGETPLNYLQKLRIDSAKNMLEEKSKSIDEITYSIGYENSSTFRKLFKKYTGISPREYRQKFSRIS